MASRAVRALFVAVLSAATIASIVMLVAGNCGGAPPGAELANGGAGPGKAAIRAPEAPRVPADDTGGARLTGFVVDGLGLPVAGAEVSAELEQGAADRALTKDIAPPKVPVLWGNKLPHDAAVAAGVAIAPATASDGQFAIAGLEPGRYRLRVTGPGLVPAEVRMVPVPSDAARIVVARQVAVEGVVTDGGQPAANVTIGLRGDAIGGAIEQKSDLAGKFRFPELPEGRYQLYGYRGALAARAVRVQRLGAGPFAPIELRLEAASIVVGRVIDRDEGTGIPAAVELRPSGDDQAPRYARSGDDGVFRVEGVPNGRWIAEAYAPGFLGHGGVELEAGRGVPELAMTRAGAIEGRVVDGAGAPIAGATVRAIGGGATEISELVEDDKLRRFSGFSAAPTPAVGAAGADPMLLPRGELGVLVGPIPPLPPPGAASARPAIVDPTYAALAGDPAPLPEDPARASVWQTGADGRYRIAALPKGRVSVLAVAPGFAEGRSREVAIDAGQLVTKIDVVLTPGTILVGRVTDQRGTPVVGAQLSAVPEVGAAVDTFTDADGTYRLGPLAGTVDVAVSSYGHGDARREVELPVAKGADPVEHTEDFTLVVADATLAGTLDDANGTPVAGAQLEVVGGAGEGRYAVAAADGTFAIEMLPAGPLRVRIRHPDYPPHETEAIATSGTAQERARLRLPLGGAIEGVVLDASSGAPLTGITVTGAGPRNARAEAVTNEAGLWKLGPLAPGRWKLEVELAGYLPLATQADVIAARTPGGTTVRDVRLELQRGALVGGTVRDRRGNRLAGVAITIRRVDGTGATRSGTTDTVGEFRIRDTPTGDVEVIATLGDRRGVTRVTVRPGDEVLGLALDVP